MSRTAYKIISDFERESSYNRESLLLYGGYLSKAINLMKIEDFTIDNKKYRFWFNIRVKLTPSELIDVKNRCKKFLITETEKDDWTSFKAPKYQIIFHLDDIIVSFRESTFTPRGILDRERIIKDIMGLDIKKYNSEEGINYVDYISIIQNKDIMLATQVGNLYMDNIRKYIIENYGKDKEVIELCESIGSSEHDDNGVLRDRYITISDVMRPTRNRPNIYIFLFKNFRIVVSSTESFCIIHESTFTYLDQDDLLEIFRQIETGYEKPLQKYLKKMYEINDTY